MIHKSKAIAEPSWCIDADHAYVYRYEDGKIKYLNKDGKRWQNDRRDTGVSDEEADRMACAWGINEGQLPEIRKLEVHFEAISYTCDGITFDEQAIPIQTLKYVLGQLVPFVYECSGIRGIEVQPQLLVGRLGSSTEPKELNGIIKTWELVNQKKECGYCGRYLDETKTLCKVCNTTQGA